MLLFDSSFLFCRQGDDLPVRVSRVDDLERIRISRHKLERYILMA